MRESRDVVARLQRALIGRVAIEQAKGIVADRAQISVDAAFARLCTHARDHNRRLSDVARLREPHSEAPSDRDPRVQAQCSGPCQEPQGSVD